MACRGDGHRLGNDPMSVAQHSSTETVKLMYVPRKSYERLLSALASCGVQPIYRRGTVEMPALMHGLTWDAYSAILDVAGDDRLRHTYNSGTLEIMMSPTRDHEWVKKLLARMIEAYCLKVDIAIQSVGSMTMRRADLDKGVEPDECYYVKNEPLVRGKQDYDPLEDPPPDLAIEVDWTKSSEPRLPVFAALGVSEIWRWDDERVAFFVRTRAGEYRTRSRSRAFPFLRSADLIRFLTKRHEMSENALVRAFVDWAIVASKRRSP
jgi:Uma2 family endonuclease